MNFTLRKSVDAGQTVRYTDKQIYNAIESDNVIIERGLLIRKKDGAVLGEILTPKNKYVQNEKNGDNANS